MSKFKKRLAVAAFVALAGSLLYFNAEKMGKGSFFASAKVEKKEEVQSQTVFFGEVIAHREFLLQPEVSGKIIEIAPQMEVGGMVRKGQVLVAIDPSNYEVALEEAKAFLAKAELELKIEEGRKLLAQKEWELLDPEKKHSSICQELALREPFLKEKKACLQSAQAKLRKALLDAQRTALKAPFNAIVTEEFIEVGQVVTAMTKLASLVCTDEFRIKVDVPYESLKELSIPEKQGELGSKVLIVQDLEKGKKIEREGRVVRLLGNLNPKTYTACILIELKDPFLLEDVKKKNAKAKLPFLLGSRVQVQLYSGLKQH